jgi:protocatechuate 3,4-dioxygenase beta subunit
MVPFCLLAAALLMQSPPANEPKPATVEGSVSHAASKVPIRKAKVTLQTVGRDQSASVETDDTGKYILKDIRAGRYIIRAEKNGYEAAAYGAKRPGDAVGQLLNIGAGATLTGIDIAVPKQGAIAGKVLDGSGEPVNAALVIALAQVYYQNGRRARIPRGAVPVMSNDLGEYRVGQLPPGKYIICAIPKDYYQPSPASDKESKAEVKEADVTACFPSAPQMSEATEIEIRDGTEIPSTDIRLARTRTVNVQGRLTNLPASAGSISLLNLNTKTAGPMGTAIHPRAIVQGDGRFEFRNVVPGSYILHTLPTGLGNIPFVVKTELIVGDRPIQNLEIPVTVPFELKGKVEAEPSPELKLTSVRVILTGADHITSALPMATATADGGLTLPNVVPGRYWIQFTGIPSTHYIREIRVGDQAAASDEVEISGPGAALTIALGLAKSELSGTVRNEKGEPVPGATVTAVANPMRAFRNRGTRTDANGAFQLKNLAPGDYRIIAFDAVDVTALENEEFVKPFVSKMKPVKTEDGGSQTLDLSVVSGSQQ